MSPSPTANQSFLHGNGKAALITNKVVYATLDSLALKQTRLPLQLLPVESDNVDKPDKKEKKLINGRISNKRPSYKVCHYSYRYSILLLDELRCRFYSKKDSRIYKL